MKKDRGQWFFFHEITPWSENETIGVNTDFPGLGAAVQKPQALPAAAAECCHQK
jgi:hypothetical protein